METTLKLKPLERKGDKAICPYCGYEWTPRIKNPKECPRCKRYFL